MHLDEPRDIRVTCAPALAPFLANEIEALGLPVVRQTKTIVTTRGTFEDSWRLCLELRTGFQVLFPLHTFRCTSPDDLYREARSVEWEKIIPPEGYLTVESRVDHPSINNSMFPNLRLKDAIVDRMTAEIGRRPDSGPDRRGVVVHLFWKDDLATIALNAAGRKLADRGYRRSPHRAPMQETLAAAVIQSTGWDGTSPLVLPMCGSGTLAIEAALMAQNRAPGSIRTRFGFESVLDFDADRWKTIRIAAKKRTRKQLDVPIIATDIDEQAIEAAKRNAETAGVTQLIGFGVCDFADTRLPETPGTIIVNPEYGARMGDEAALRPTYERLGSWFKKACVGWSCFVFSGNRNLTGSLGLKASERVPFFNAEIECRLLRYDMWR